MTAKLVADLPGQRTAPRSVAGLAASEQYAIAVRSLGRGFAILIEAPPQVAYQSDARLLLAGAKLQRCNSPIGRTGRVSPDDLVGQRP